RITIIDVAYRFVILLIVNYCFLNSIVVVLQAC
ncbi:MAG: hypothetical protein ACI8O8_001603, partial [Oleiphilaceae bacterium]